MLDHKLVVKVWCLPARGEEELRAFHKSLVATVVEQDVGVQDENDMITLFPRDMMDYGLGKEILVEIFDFPFLADINKKGLLVGNVCSTVKQSFPDAQVQCSLRHTDMREMSAFSKT